MKPSSLALTNRILMGILPFLALGIALDLSRGTARSGHEGPPMKPVIEDLTQAPAPIPSPGLSAALFQVSMEAVDSAAPLASVVRDVQWKLKGVILGGNKRAFLEDSEGGSLWVTEGESLGSTTRIKEIRARSVILEKQGKNYEIQM